MNNLNYMLFLLPIVMSCGMIFRAYKAEELKEKMNEVLNGITDFSKWNIGLIPSGSGNDFASIVGLKAKDHLNNFELQVVVLYAVYGYKHREIAKILNKPLGSILWTYNNSIKKLQKVLKKEDRDEA